MTTPWVVLLGPPGSGVSTVAREVAALRGLPLRDTERAAAAGLGHPGDVSTAFVVAGEAAFRAAETAAALDAVAEPGVVALGSGALNDPAVREAIAELRIIQLTVSLAHAAPRLGLATARPVFLGNPRAQWSLHAARNQETYDALAVASIDTDDRTTAQVAALVVQAVEDLT